MSTPSIPKNLFDFWNSEHIEKHFISILEKLRWNGKPVSPYDPTSKVYFCPSIDRYKCKNTGKFFNVKTGTVLARSKLPLQKWFLALFLFSSHKKGISSCQLARYLGTTQKTAYWVLDDLRNNNLDQSNFIKDMLKGVIEIDETYVGGKNNNRHWDKKVPNCQGRSGEDKTPTLVMVERGGNAIAQVVSNVQQNTLEQIIKANIEEGSTVNTDEWLAYKDLGKWYKHLIVNHRKKQYANGEAYVNTAESFNNCLKGTIKGTYHWISKGKSQGYMNEIAFRYNTRKWSEKDRFELLLSSVVGKNMTYGEFINC